MNISAPQFIQGCIRPLAERDLDLVLCWRNNHAVRGYMYTQHEITPTEHQQWFERASKEKSRYLLIYEVAGVPLGFLNFNRINNDSPVADWGFYIAPDAPKGTGHSLGKTGLDYAFDTLGLHKVCGQALDFNERSIYFHRRLGFTQEGTLQDQYFDGQKYHDIICFGLLRSVWYIFNKRD